MKEHNPAKRKKVKQIPDVDCIARGYEWTCPKCSRLNVLDAWTEEAQTCSYCKQEVRLSVPEHALD